MQHLLTWGTFPVLFFGTLSAAAWALPRYPHALVLAAATLGPALVIAALERVHPYEDRWNEPRGDVPADLLHMIFSTLAMPELIRATLFGLFALGAGALSEALGSPLWPDSWPWWGQLLLALGISEFGQYWMHRGMHETELLWPLHAVHHSAERLYWLNAGRFHPLDTFLNFTLQTGPLVLMGAPAETLALFAVFTAVHGLFQHGNLDIRLGPLNWFFSMAELHRWHHSRELHEANSNYGANVIWWDVVFGTRLLPPHEPPRVIGITDMPRFPKTYLAQLASPFRWRAVVAESREP